MSSSSPSSNTGATSSTTPRRAPAPARWFMGLAVGLYRRSGGRIGGRIAGTAVLLLTTTGRRSGKLITRPVGYFELDGMRYIVASNGGAPTDPAWYRNLLAHPEVTVEVGRERYQATAVPTAGEERARLWQHTVQVAPAYGKYTSSPREIPVVVLRPPA